MKEPLSPTEIEALRTDVRQLRADWTDCLDVWRKLLSGAIIELRQSGATHPVLEELLREMGRLVRMSREHGEGTSIEPSKRPELVMVKRPGKDVST